MARNEIEQIMLNAIRHRSEDEFDTEGTVRSDRAWLLRYIARREAEIEDLEARLNGVQQGIGL